MKFRITSVSGKEAVCKNSFKEDGEQYINIDSVEELLNVIEQVGNAILFKRYRDEICVYDDYIE